MKREIQKELIRWQDSPDRMPLILRGARQVGKTWIVEHFGNEYFESVLSVNLEVRQDVHACFENLDAKKIVAQLEIRLGQKIAPGKTLLFLDEIQQCPKALVALRYFKEMIPELHVIAAGSLLEFVLHDASYSFPVGRVQFMYLKPLSFREFLVAMGEELLVEHLKTISLTNPLEKDLHQKLLDFVRSYFLVGGMPHVVKSYISMQSFLNCVEIQESLMRAYQEDFGKYAEQTQHKYLKILFQRVPEFIGCHVKYSKIDTSVSNPQRAFKYALEQLAHAGLLNIIYATKANGLPLRSQKNTRKFKVTLLDVGLLQCAMGTKAEEILSQNLIQINQGALAEQFVGQELLAYVDFFRDRKLYFWEREKAISSAEVDYVFGFQGSVFPIEVKAGKIGRLKSLQQFMEIKKTPIGLRISENPLSLEKNILSVPFYLIGELDRLIERKCFNHLVKCQVFR